MSTDPQDQNPQLIDLALYERAFNNDKSKMHEFITILKADLHRFMTEFLNSYNANDLASMREEMHKIEPIVSQIRFTELQELLIQYKNYIKIDESMLQLNKSLVALISKLISTLDCR